LAGNSNSYRKYFCRQEFQKIKDNYSGKFAEILENAKCNFLFWQTICPDISCSTLQYIKYKRNGKFSKTIFKESPKLSINKLKLCSNFDEPSRDVE
jgi:hypothetical protein